MNGKTVPRYRSSFRAAESAGQPVSRLVTPVAAASGFTLLELIIAFTILALVSGIIFSSFRLAVNSYVKSQERLVEKAQERVLQDEIKRQIGSLFPLRPTGSFLQQQQQQFAQRQAPTQPVTSLGQAPLFHGTQDSMTFITVAPLMFQQNPGLTVVRYGLSEDSRGDPYLGAMEMPFSGLDSYDTMVRVPGGEPLSLIKDLSELRFEYYGYDSEAQTYEWYDFWSGEEMLSVPNAVRILYDDEQMVVPINASFFGGPLLGRMQGRVQR